MRKWPYLLLLLGACSSGDEHPPMLGDCMTCGQAPISAGGSSGGGGQLDASIDNFNNSPDVGNFDALSIVDVQVNLDAPIPP
jgi:hypothetical protein